MGRVIDEYAVGSEELPDVWIRGWIYEAGNAALDEEEFKTPVDYRHSLRGIGRIAKGYVTSQPAYGTTFVFPWGKEALGYSWVNSGDDYDAATDATPSPPWWWIGPCGRIVGYALAAAAVTEKYGTTLTGEDPEHWSGNPATITYEFSGPGKLSTLTANLEGFLDYIYDAFYTVVVTVTTSYKLNKDKLETVVTEQRFSYLYAENPFPLANPLMSKADFIASLNNGYLVRLIEQFQVYCQDAFDNQKHAASYITNFKTIEMPLSLFVFPCGGGDWYDILGSPNYNKFTEFSGFNAINKYRKGYRVVNYELGAMYYNTAINYHFSSTVMDFTGAIVVRPEGHISYCKKDLFDFKIGYSAQSVFYEENIPQLYYSAFLTDKAMPTKDDIEWKSVDGLSWYYGKIKTNHLSVYNLAYQPVTGDARKKALRSEEIYDDYYKETQFTPDFRLNSNHAYFRWFYPLYDENGRFEIMERMTTPMNDRMSNGPMSHPARHDPRPKKTYIRLSPLFF